MTNPQFSNGQIYHLYNRGVEKRNIFLDDFDYLRCVHDIFEFNDTEPALPSNVRFLIRRPSVINSNLKQCLEVRLPNIKKPRKFLVEILSFSLMPNHFHLMVRQKIEGGITKFMRKFGTGYTNYFNQRYEREGVLFQGKFKAVLVNQNSHFIHLSYYIHLNPLDLVAPEWRKGKIKDYKKAVKFLEKYRWSSYLDFIGKKNFSSVTQKEFLLEFFGGSNQYKKGILKWLKEMGLKEVENMILK